MKMRSLLALGLVWLCSLASAASPPDPADARCEWLLGLHLKMMPAKDLPIVRVPVSWSQRTGEKARVVYTLGFLESDDGKNYVVRSLCLHRFSQPHSYGPEKDPESAKALRKLTTSEAATQWCDWLDDDPKHDMADRLFMGRPADVFTQCMVFAAALYERGDLVAAHLLHQRAMQMTRRLSEGPATKDFDRDLREDLAHALFKGIEEDMGDLSQTREALLERLEEIPRHFPGTTTFSTAERMSVALKTVIAQAAQPRPSDAELAKLPIKERVAELIRQLPDQTGYQMTMPGYCNVFAKENGWGFNGGYWTFGYALGNDARWEEARAITPAGKLLEIGLDAVPQLIEAIDDPRPTRATGIGAPNWQRSSALDVGDCVLQILQRLSERSFTGPNLPSAPDATRARIKTNVQSWWKEVQDGTEADTLDREISSGKGEYNLAGRLIKIDPARTVAAIERGMSKAEKPWDAKWMLTPLSTIDSDAARQLIFRQITAGRYLSVRIAAARMVWQTPSRADRVPLFSADQQRQARESLLAEWNKFPSARERVESSDDPDLADLLARMAMKTPGLLETLDKTLGNHAPNLRVKFVDTLAIQFPNLESLPKPPMDAALEKFLASQLEDVAFSTKVYFKKTGNISGEGARVADDAAALLARLWPDRYHFSWDASGDDMEKARVACLNTWRISQKLPPLSAAPAVLTPDQDAATVVRAGVGHGSLPLKGDWPKWLHSLEGKTLAGEDLVSLLVAFAEQNSEDKQSIRLAANRQSARSGFVVEITSGHEVVSPSNGSNYGLDVIVNGRPFMGESGGLELHLAHKYDLYSYKQWCGKIAEALKTPNTTVFIQAVRLAKNPTP